MILNVKGTEYVVTFGYNSFCDTDLMERTESLVKLFNGSDKNDSEIGVSRVKELFLTVRSLLFVGFQKENPVKKEQEVGDILDEYVAEETEEKRGILELFLKISDELFRKGFLKGLIAEMGDQTEENQETEIRKIPQDHKRRQKKTTTDQ